MHMKELVVQVTLNHHPCPSLKDPVLFMSHTCCTSLLYVLHPLSFVCSIFNYCLFLTIVTSIVSIDNDDDVALCLWRRLTVFHPE